MDQNPAQTPKMVEKDIILRDEHGRLLPGTAPLNPLGAAAVPNPWQPYAVRLQKWLAKPWSEIKPYADDPDKMDELSMIDAACVRHCIGMIKGKKVVEERESALDRIEGKSVKMVRMLGNSGPTPAEIGAMSDEEAARLYEQSLKE